MNYRNGNGAVLLRVLLPILLATLGVAQAEAIDPRTLKVAVYPYVPTPQAMWFAMKVAFEQENPAIRLEFVDLTSDYYQDGKLVDAVLKAKADVFEVDTVFLADLVAAKALQPDLVGLEANAFLPVAERAVRRDGRVYGLPHWVCSNYLFFPKADPAAPALAVAKTVQDVANALGPSMRLALSTKPSRSRSPKPEPSHRRTLRGTSTKRRSGL